MRWTSTALLILIAPFAFGGVNTWTTSGPEGVQAANISADPSNPDTLFVLTPAGVYRSTDGAATWVSANEGLKSTALNTFAVAGGDLTTLYAAIGREIWRSTDRGDHWSRRGAVDYSVYSLAYSRSQRTLFAIPTGQSGLFSSVDGGTSWQLVVIQQPFPVTIYALQTSQTAVFAQLAGGSALRSIDGGLTWTAVTMPSSIALFATEDSRVVFGVALPHVFVSEDDGKTWTQLPDAPTDQIFSIRMIGSAIYAATADGVLGYDSARKAWTLIGPEQAAFSLAIASTSPLRMYATSASGVIAYNDAGFATANRGLPDAPARSVALSAKETFVAYGSTSEAIYRTDDAGNSWRSVAAAGADLAVSPASGVVYAATESGVSRSSDGGKTWTGVSPASRFSLTRVAVAHSDPATVYAVVSDGLFKSTDSGDTWSSISHDLSSDYYDYYGFTTTAMAVDPANADSVAIAKYSGVFVTSDGGKTWQHPLGDSNLPALTFDPTSLYAARADIGIEKSFDFGLSWSGAGLIDKRVSALATIGTTLFAGTADGRVYRSDDGGTFWNAFEEGLSRGSIRELAVDPSGQRLYAATAGGFYEFDLVRHALTARPFASSRSIDDYLNGPSLVIPVAGKAMGGDGTIFTTDVLISNSTDTPQAVVLAWLPLGSGSPAFFQAELPAGDTRVIDINEELGVTGIGSLAVFGVDASGSARVWSHAADGRAPFSQSIDAAGGVLLQAHGHAAIGGIRVDAHKRVNVGIVNLSPQPHRFTVGDIALTVAPFSLAQVPLPAANGAIEAFADDSALRWIFYASEIDRTTGEIRTVMGPIQ